VGTGAVTWAYAVPQNIAVSENIINRVCIVFSRSHNFSR